MVLDEHVRPSTAFVLEASRCLAVILGPWRRRKNAAREVEKEEKNVYFSLSISLSISFFILLFFPQHLRLLDSSSMSIRSDSDVGDHVPEPLAILSTVKKPPFPKAITCCYHEDV